MPEVQVELGRNRFVRLANVSQPWDMLEFAVADGAALLSADLSLHWLTTENG